MISANLIGMRELQAQLLELGNAALGAKVLASAARRAFKPVLEDAKAMVPVDSGELRDSLRLAVKKPKSGDAVVVVGLRIGGVKGSNPGAMPPARRWHFIELGTSKLAAHPFIRPALDANADQVLGLLKEELIKGIQRTVRRQAKAGK